MTRHEHTLRTAKRTFTAMIVEEPSCVLLTLTATRYGVFGDETQVNTWLGKLLARYDRDSRPVVIENQHSGQVAMVTGDATQGVVVIEEPTKQ